MPINSVQASCLTAGATLNPLNWRGGKPAAMMVTVSSSLAIGDWQLQFTYSDISNQSLITNSFVFYPPTGVAGTAGLPWSEWPIG